MTAIAGVVHNNRVWIGGDSAGVDVSNLAMIDRVDTKVFVNDGFVFGFTSSFRMGQLLHHKFTPPHYHVDEDLDKFMVTSFIDGVRDCLKAGGYSKKENEEESAGTFMVGYRGRLFLINDDYQVGESRDGYDACGCGGFIVKAYFLRRRMNQIQRREFGWPWKQRHIIALAFVDHS